MIYRVSSKDDFLCISLTGECLPEVVFRYALNFGIKPLVVLSATNNNSPLEFFKFERLLTKTQVLSMIDSVQERIL